MQESRIDTLEIRNAIKTKRNQMFADFSKDPSNTRLAVEIRLLDDRIADLDGDPGIKTQGHCLNKNSVFH